MTSFCTFASYLASLNPPQHQNGAISPDSSSLSSAEGSLSTSPTKRPRADSPDTSVSSSSPVPDHYFTTKQLSVAPVADLEVEDTSETITLITAPAPSSTCIVRSILCATFSDYDVTLSSPSSSSPPLSRPLSRRSSTGCSTKSVRFARCTNASVFPALSIEEYDRSPIIPTTESESLELPKRKRGEAEGWIKCVERERAAAAKRGVDAGAANVKSACGSRPSVTLSSLDNPVEGVHGLIEGGYFVGEERDVDESFDETEELDVEGMVVDDEEDLGAGGLAQALIQDDSSGDEDLTEASEYRSRGSSSSLNTITPHTSEDGHHTTTSPSSAGLGIERIDQQDEEAEEDDETRERREKEEERARSRQKCRERYGLCALGKYTRQEVFQSYDSLGGF